MTTKQANNLTLHPTIKTCSMHLFEEKLSLPSVRAVNGFFICKISLPAFQAGDGHHIWSHKERRLPGKPVKSET